MLITTWILILQPRKPHHNLIPEPLANLVLGVSLSVSLGVERNPHHCEVLEKNAVLYI